MNFAKIWMSAGMVLTSAIATAQITTPLVINEICSSNIDQWIDPSFNYGGWVELYNPSDQSVTITNWRLSGDPDNLRKARVTQYTSVPAHGYKVLWFDNYHPRYSPKTIDMKLDLDGGTLYISDANGNLLLQQDYPAAVSRCSWARTTNGGEEWQYCANPSVGFSNEGRQYASEQLAAPEVEGDSRVWNSGNADLYVKIPDGCTLRYTTDGSAPTLNNGSISTTGKFSTSTTRQYRFRLFADGYLPSAVVTRSLIRDSHNIDLPILSINSTQKNFYSDSIGIFTKGGINGRPGRGSNEKCNWNQDWERPAVFEYFTSDGEILFSQETGIERCGGWSRAWNPWSFKIKANRRYDGKKTLDYPFFDEKPYLKQKTLQIRNGGNDNGCRVRDPFLQQIIATSGIDVDYQAYQPVAQFINGSWRGTINMREPNNKHFVYANYGYDDDEIDQFEMSPDSGYVQNCGDNAAWKKLVSYAKSSSNPQWYEQVKGLLDIDAFCNYMAIQFYLRNWDWPQNNVKAWRPRLDADGRFRFVLFDLDGFDGTSSPFTTFDGKQNYTFDYCYDTNRRYTKEIELVTIFKNLLDNQEFRQHFIDAFTLVTYSVFSPSRCKAMINQMANRVAPTQALYNNESPWGTANQLISALSSSRQTQMMTQLKNYSRMKLTGKTSHTATITAEIDEAQLTFNGQPIPLNYFSGKYYNTVTVTAVAPACYTFEGWKRLTTETRQYMNTNNVWKYYDKGTLDNKNWQNIGYDDSSWAEGAAPLGFFTDGHRDYATILNYGTNSNNKRPTYYFRTIVNLDHKPADSEVITLNFTVDDGFVVYVNGTEAGRYNMPSGKITYSTYASTYANDNPDSGTMTLDASLFVSGNNTIAVELHNHSANSTDVYWSASMTGLLTTGSEMVSSDPTYTLPTDNDVAVIACFSPAATPLNPVVINEVSAGNDVNVNEYQKKSDWIELYNTTDHDIDLAGMYLTDRLDKPTKYCISAEGSEASTIIPAHGYKIIWCDKEAPATQLHANFKLDNDEKIRQVMLTAANEAWHDTLSYTQHAGNASVGRYPDASSNVYLMTQPTIDHSNHLNAYSMTMEQPSADAIAKVELDTPDNTCYVYDLSGRLVKTYEGAFSSKGLPQGIYIVKSQGSTMKVTCY